MTTAINSANTDINVRQTGEVAKDNTAYLSAMKNHSLMGTAMVTMENVMLLFTELANAKFAQMTDKMGVSRDAQEMANRVDRELAKLAKPEDTATLPPEVLEYMRKNNILVDGKQTIDEFMGGDANKALTKDQLTAVKSSLESASGRASDFVQQSQLKLQQLMQNFNTAVTMANSIQSMNAESTKSIAQSIR
ncbi:secretion protein EspA [Aeromonas salmonicida]|uniref:secretion protein EspA n=1 Tax=Aeromonas salmonicida TaxID=645 RepID=UPI00259D3CB7|nr:secretion protein EspA [Aeromonas salmonicida]MDM5065371.1 secretion protein EspA [Aeromonas salmonicida]